MCFTQGKISILNIGKWLVVGLALLLSGYVWKDGVGEVKMVKDQKLAEKYCPIIVQAKNIKPEPEAIYYRMAEEDGTLLIAYHIAWAYEKDDQKGPIHAWTRATYTGGLHLQKIIYGPGDIEAIEFKIDKKTGKILRIRFETARFSEKGKVIHIPVVLCGKECPSKPPIYLEVISWNHLFKIITPEQAKGKKIYQLKPKYFDEKLWQYYRITKKHQGPLSRDRAHFQWETKCKD